MFLNSVLLNWTRTTEGDTYNVAGRDYPVIAYFDFDDKFIPLVDIPQMSNYKWQQKCLRDRLKHPEKYRDTEDVESTIQRLIKWLEENKN